MELPGDQIRPKAVVNQILSTLDEASILHRIKDELLQKTKLGTR